jgi:uncharacterized damage-inducible protein DinB
MTAKDAIKHALTSTLKMLEWYLSDLSDADLLVRPVPKANHIAWQLGHLISAEHHLLVGQLPGVTYPELPAGFDQRYSKETAADDSPKNFATKAEYLSLLTNFRNATVAAVSKLSDADLDKPVTGNMAKHAPTLTELLLLTANHTTMHSGQFTVVRRKLGKPILF